MTRLLSDPSSETNQLNNEEEASACSQQLTIKVRTQNDNIAKLSLSQHNDCKLDSTLTKLYHKTNSKYNPSRTVRAMISNNRLTALDTKHLQLLGEGGL